MVSFWFRLSEAAASRYSLFGTTSLTLAGLPGPGKGQ